MELAIVFAVNVASSILKKYVMPKWGKDGVQVLVFLVAFVAAVYLSFGQAYQVYVQNTLAVFVSAVAIYEVILSRFSWFKGK